MKQRPTGAYVVSSWLADLRPTGRENEQYLEAARLSGLDPAQWARQVLNLAARALLQHESSRRPTTRMKAVGSSVK